MVLGAGPFARVPQRFVAYEEPGTSPTAGIDCPELRTLAGRNARAYVEEQLSAVDFIVITTHRTDAYGRYLADVRYLAGETDAEVVRRRGTYLNRALLDQRLARRYT